MSNRSNAVLATAFSLLVAGFLTAAAPPPDPGGVPGTKPGKTPKVDPGGTPAPIDPDAPLIEPEPEPVVVKEVFEVSNVGRPKAKESREVLLTIFEEVSKRHAVEMAARKGDEMAKAETFRILERISGPESEGENLCLCEQGGGFSVVSFPEGAFPRGETTPPMAAEKLGTMPYRL